MITTTIHMAFGFIFGAALGLAATQQPDEIEPDCAVLVKFTLHSYSGPIVIEDACLSAHELRDGLLTVEAREFLGDGVFRGDFEVWP